MRQSFVVLGLAVLLAACEGPTYNTTNNSTQDADTMPNFFSFFTAADLGSTKIVAGSNLGMGNRGATQKMLDLSVDNKYAAPLIVSIRTEYNTDQGTVSQDGTIIGPGYGTGAGQIGSPIVATLQWGVGGGKQEMTFDVPAPRFPDLFYPNPPQQQENNIGNGVQIPISASHVSLYVRNDGWLGPLTNPTGDYSGSPTQAKVIAFVGPDTGQSGGRIERTIFVAGGNMGGPPAATPLAVGGVMAIRPIPPLAKSVRFQRLPMNSTIQVTAQNNFGTTYREFPIAVNSEGPMLIDGMCQSIVITNTSAAAISYLQAVFDVTP